MNIISICVLSVVAVIICAALKSKNAEISAMLALSCSVIVVVTVLTRVSEIVAVINELVSAAGLNTEYMAILLKCMGICLVTEFAVNACTDSGSRSLAGSVSLAGKIMVTVTALPLYSDILNVVLSLTSG